jgi:hypothetical protein
LKEQKEGDMGSCKQGINAVIKDLDFYNKWKDYFLPKEKKLLTVAIEQQGENEYALAPKTYAFESEDEITMKAKGFMIKNGIVSAKDFEEQVKGAEPLKMDTTQIHSSTASVMKKTVNKTVISSCTDKGVAQDDQSYSVLPFYSGYSV